MKFNLGVVGHADTLAMVNQLVEEYFDQVTVYPEEFGNDEIMEDAVKRIAQLQTKCDGILYSRRDPYLLISEHLEHTVPVRYVEIHRSHLLISLLEAILRYDIKPAKISVDGLERPVIMEAFEMVGLSPEEMTVYMVNTGFNEEDLVNATLKQHLENYANGAELCITNITDVGRSLRERNIPATVINPSPKSFIHEIRHLMLRHELKSQDAEPIAVMHIRLRYKDRYRFVDKMPIREVDELSNAAKLIAIFAEGLDGAMYTLSRWEYLVFCNGTLLQESTAHYTNFGLMQKIEASTIFNIAIGIGCGETVREAERNASIASEHTRIHRGTNTIVALGPDQLIGPLRPKSEKISQESTTDARLTEIANNTGISSNVLNDLFQATLMQNSPLFTSAQLAEHLDVSRRTVNRIVERLLEHGYAAVEGKHLSQSRGRPARVIRLLF